MRLETGKCLISRGLANSISENPSFAKEVRDSFNKYVNGDWGDLSEDDKVANENALIYGDRILATYNTSIEKIYIITEWDRSYTTLMFASEY